MGANKGNSELRFWPKGAGTSSLSKVSELGDGRAVKKVIFFLQEISRGKLYMILLDVRVFNFAGLFTDYKILVSVQLFNFDDLKGSHFFNSKEQSSTGQSVLQNPMLKA